MFRVDGQVGDERHLWAVRRTPAENPEGAGCGRPGTGGGGRVGRDRMRAGRPRSQGMPSGCAAREVWRATSQKSAVHPGQESRWGNPTHPGRWKPHSDFVKKPEHTVALDRLSSRKLTKRAVGARQNPRSGLTQTLIIINFSGWSMVHVLSNWLAVRSLLKSGLTGFLILAPRLGYWLRSARCRLAISAVQSPLRECRG